MRTQKELAEFDPVPRRPISDYGRSCAGGRRTYKAGCTRSSLGPDRSRDVDHRHADCPLKAEQMACRVTPKSASSDKLERGQPLLSLSIGEGDAEFD
jgi:hypothetical protein